MMKKILPVLFLIFISAKTFSQTPASVSADDKNIFYVSVIYLLNDLQKPVQLKVVKAEPDSILNFTDPLLLKAINIKMSELPQEILVNEWSDYSQTYIMHLIYDAKKHEVQ